MIKRSEGCRKASLFAVYGGSMWEKGKGAMWSGRCCTSIKTSTRLGKIRGIYEL